MSVASDIVKCLLELDGEGNPSTGNLYGVRGRLILTWYRIMDRPKTWTYNAVVSRNTKPAPEKPYRLSWFSKGMNISGHVSCSKREADLLMQGQTPDRIRLILVRGFNVSDARFKVVNRG